MLAINIQIKQEIKNELVSFTQNKKMFSKLFCVKQVIKHFKCTTIKQIENREEKINTPRTRFLKMFGTPTPFF